MGKFKYDVSCFKSRKNNCMYAIWFGLGLTIGSFCPAGFVAFIASVIIVALGITLIRY